MDEKGETEEGTKGGRVGMESIERKIGIEEKKKRGSKKKGWRERKWTRKGRWMNSKEEVSLRWTK